MHDMRFFLTDYNLKKILTSLIREDKSVIVSPDLNLTQVDLPLKNRRINIGGRVFTGEDLEELADKCSGVIMVEDGEMLKLEFFAGRYYKLRPTDFAPTVEIDGIRMHRTKGINPWEDSRQKAAMVVKTGDIVLDTCGGLGYTAIWAVKLGAKRVVTVEKDLNIIELRTLNPHSAEFFSDKVISMEGEVQDIILHFREGGFDCIIHDPPRFSFAGELYGSEFYREMSRVLRIGGRLYHYTGDPYSRGRGRRFIEGVLGRLKRAGFDASHRPKELGVYALKI